MKKIFFLAALGLLFACGNNNPNNNTPAEPKQEAFSVENYNINGRQLLGIRSVGEDAYEQYASYQCLIDIPVTDNQALRDSICYWFASNFGSLYDGDPRDVKAMVDYYKDYALDPGLEVNPVGFDMGYTVQMMEVTDRYVTYSFEDYYEAYTDPRGSSEIECCTFDRNTGKHFTRQMIKADETLKELVMNALLEQYFYEIWGNDDLSDLLFFDPEDLEERGFFLPQYDEPWIFNNSVCFGYSEHEIADRCTGQPHCALPYSVMKPYLTEEGQAFFE